MSRTKASRRALVTGGAGFIGSHVVDNLRQGGWSVRVLDDLSSGREQNLASSRAEIDFVHGDVCQQTDRARALCDVDVVFHLAAIASVPQSLEDPQRTHRVNLQATLELLEACRGSGVSRLVFAGSSAAYGDAATLPLCESAPARPLSPYALEKYSSELYCQLYASLFGLETAVLRYFNVFGPRQNPESDYAAVIPLFASAALRGETLCIHGDGQQTRDFVFVEDAAEATVRAGTVDAASGGVFNVASGRRASVEELARIVASSAGREVSIAHVEARAGDVRHSWADTSRAREILGWQAAVDLETGLSRTLAALRDEDTAKHGEVEKR